MSDEIASLTEIFIKTIKYNLTESHLSVGTHGLMYPLYCKNTLALNYLFILTGSVFTGK